MNLGCSSDNMYFKEPSALGYCNIPDFSCLQESADNVSSDSDSPSKDALLEEACRKYEEATRLCPTLNDVCSFLLFLFHWVFHIYCSLCCQNESIGMLIFLKEIFVWKLKVSL